MRPVIIFLMLLVFGVIGLMMYNQYTTEQHQEQSLAINSGDTQTIVPDDITRPVYTTTPLPDRSHYIPVSKYVSIQYPKRYDVKTFQTGSLVDRLSVLPAQDRQRYRYLVVRRLGMIVPVLANKNIDQDFFVSDKTDGLLEGGAVMHPFDETSPLIIGGHTSYYTNKAGRYKTIFQSLVLLEAGDIIELYKKDAAGQRGVSRYTVAERSIVTPDEQQQLSGTSEDLILYGCYPFGSTEKRVVVKSIKLLRY